MLNVVILKIILNVTWRDQIASLYRTSGRTGPPVPRGRVGPNYTRGEYVAIFERVGIIDRVDM